MRNINKSRTGIGIIIFVVLMICAVVAYSKNGLEEQSEKSKIQIEKIESRILEQRERKIYINNLKAYIQTNRYIEDMAREKLGLVYEDDIILKAED